MNHNYQSSFGAVLLLPIGKSDMVELRSLRNKSRKFFFDNSYKSERQQDKWYNQYVKKNNDYMFKIVYSSARYETLGFVAIYDIDLYNARAEVGKIMINEDKRGKGIGADAIRSICIFGFGSLGLSSVYANVLTSNISSIKMFRKVGFVEKGIKHKDDKEILFLEYNGCDYRDDNG